MGRRPGTAHCDPWPRTTLRQAPTVAISANAYGAGKTTTVRILATLSRPDGGRARVAGFDVVRDRRQVRRRISLTGQFAALDAAQTGEENLRMIARLAGQSRAAARRRAGELLEQFAAGSTWPPAWPAGRPSVIFLDEPTTGLDPQSRLITWQAISDLAAAGMTVFLTTQYLDKADRLAGQIAVLDGGLVVAAGTAAELKRRVAAQRLDLTCSTAGAYEQVSHVLHDRVVHLDPAARTVGVATDGSAAQVRALLDEADPGRYLVASFAVHSATLDDVFFALTAPDKEAVHA